MLFPSTCDGGTYGTKTMVEETTPVRTINRERDSALENQFSDDHRVANDRSINTKPRIKRGFIIYWSDCSVRKCNGGAVPSFSCPG